MRDVIVRDSFGISRKCERLVYGVWYHFTISSILNLYFSTSSKKKEIDVSSGKNGGITLFLVRGKKLDS
jgi:hypothetical protein